MDFRLFPRDDNPADSALLVPALFWLCEIESRRQRGRDLVDIYGNLQSFLHLSAAYVLPRYSGGGGGGCPHGWRETLASFQLHHIASRFAWSTDGCGDRRTEHLERILNFDDVFASTYRPDSGCPFLHAGWPVQQRLG